MIWMLSIIIIISTQATFWLIRKQFFSIFTDDQEVLDQVLGVSWLVAIGIFPDYWQAMMNGSIRALNM